MDDQLYKQNNTRAWKCAIDKYKSIKRMEKETYDSARHFRPLEADETPYFREDFISILETIPRFDLARCRSPLQIYQRIFTDDVVKRILLHGYRSTSCLFPDGPKEISLQPSRYHSIRNFHLYMADLIHDFCLSGTTKGGMTQSDLKVAKKPYNNGERALAWRQFKHYRKCAVFPTAVIAGPISENLRGFILNIQDVLNVLDERKQEFHGHSDTIRIVRNKPVLFLIQVGVQLPGSKFPFIHTLVPQNYSKGEVSYSRKEQLELDGRPLFTEE